MIKFSQDSSYTLKRGATGERRWHKKYKEREEVPNTKNDLEISEEAMEMLKRVKENYLCL